MTTSNETGQGATEELGQGAPDADAAALAPKKRAAAKKTATKKATAAKKAAPAKKATGAKRAAKAADAEPQAAPPSDALPAGEGVELPQPKKTSRAKKTAAADPAAIVDLSGKMAEHAARTGVGPAFASPHSEPAPTTPPVRLATTALLFQAPDPAAAPAPRSTLAEAPAKPERKPSTKSAGTSGSKKGTKASDAAAEGDGSESRDVAASGDDDLDASGQAKKRRRGSRGRRGRGGKGDEPRGENAEVEDEPIAEPAANASEPSDSESGSSRRRRRRRTRAEDGTEDTNDEVTALKGSTRLEAKKLRRREGRDAGRRRTVITESEFLARRESVARTMVVRERDGRTQIAVLEDGVLVEHYVSRRTQTTMVGNVYLGRVQNVLPSMEAAFVDVGKGRNAVLYAGEVNWDAAGLEGQPRRIEQALSSGDSVMVQVTKDPIGHKGARLTSQITLAGRYLVFVPGGGMSGISRKLPDTERSRLKKLLAEIVPDGAGVIVRTAAEGASEDELRRDVERLSKQWQRIEKKSKTASSPAVLQEEPDLAIRVIRDIFNEDFAQLVISGEDVWHQLDDYIGQVAPDLQEKMSRWTGKGDVFAHYRIDEQLAKGMDRKVWLPSGGSLVIDRTEAMTVIDVNTGKFTGTGGTLEETVTRNNLEAAEEIVRQLRLRDIGGIIVIDFIDMVLESNRDLVLRRLVECLGRDRTRHQVAEVTSLGLVQMTRKRVGQGLVEAFSEPCDACGGRGFIVHSEPVEKGGQGASEPSGRRKRQRPDPPLQVPVLPEVSSPARQAVNATLASIAAAAAQAHDATHPSGRSDGAEPSKPDEERIVGDVGDDVEIETILVPVRRDPKAVVPANLTTIPGTDIMVFADPVSSAPAEEATDIDDVQVTLVASDTERAGEPETPAEPAAESTELGSEESDSMGESDAAGGPAFD